MFRRSRLWLVLVPVAFSWPFLLGFHAPEPTVPDLHQPAESAQATSRLAVLWTSGDRDVALKTAFLYTLNAKRQGWFDEVTLIVWGPSSKLLSEDAELQERVRDMAEVGLDLVACKWCSDSYGVSEALERLGIEVKYMGAPLTEMLKADWEVLTF
jgi:hypothetical protein